MNSTKITLFFGMLLLGVCTLTAQDLEFPDLDASPMDAANFPRSAAFNNYLDEDQQKDLKIKVLYCRPKKKDRVIFGGLVPYGEDWRLGANEATEVRFYSPVEIGGTFVPAGTYTMFAEVHPNHWIIKISKQRHIGGSANRDASQDIVRAVAHVTHTATTRESFAIGFKELGDNKCKMIFEWDQTRAMLPIGLNPAYMPNDDASPMDLAQYPSMSRFHNFLKEEELEANQPKVRVVYSRPQKKSRKIFGELIKYGEPWRLGANETTEITFFDDVKIGGKDVKAGTYGLMAKVNENAWDFVVHKNIPSWGPANHDDEKNVASLSVPVTSAPSEVEALSMVFEKADGNTVNLVVAWDKTMVKLPIEL